MSKEIEETVELLTFNAVELTKCAKQCREQDTEENAVRIEAEAQKLSKICAWLNELIRLRKRVPMSKQI